MSAQPYSTPTERLCWTEPVKNSPDKLAAAVIVSVFELRLLVLRQTKPRAALPATFDDAADPRIEFLEKKLVLLDRVRAARANGIALDIGRARDIDDLDQGVASGEV